MNLSSTNKKIKNKKNIKNNENINKIILNKFDLNEKTNKNEIYIINNTETETQENKELKANLKRMILMKKMILTNKHLYLILFLQ